MSGHAGLFAIVGARVIDPANGIDGERTVLVRDGRIAGVESPGALPSFDGVRGERIERIDARGLWLLPGFVDLHAHLREPGEEHKETIATGAKAAVAGGYTTIVAIANTRPPIDNAALVRFVKKKGEEADLARVLPAATITLGQKGEGLTELVDLAEAGAVCFTDDGRPVANAGVMRRALEYSRLVGRPIVAHEEDLGLAGGSMHEGEVSVRLGLRGVPGAAEEVMIRRDLVLAELTGAHLHVMHVSTAGSVRAIREAKSRGVKVTAEATPHHLTLTDEAVKGYDTNAKMMPPLRPEADRRAIVEALQDGTLDAIATDHAPHATVDKELEFDKAASGIVGLETAFALTLRAVQRGELKLTRAIELLTSGPARAFQLDAGTLTVGAPADLTLIDPEARWKFDAKKSSSKSHNSPFDGWEFSGRVVRTFVGGRVRFEL